LASFPRNKSAVGANVTPRTSTALTGSYRLASPHLSAHLLLPTALATKSVIYREAIQIFVRCWIASLSLSLGGAERRPGGSQ
jgi:hypothetical protein